MERKVLIMVNWHTGVPDGGENISFVVDKFDIKDDKHVIEQVKEVLLRYGVKKITVKEEFGFQELTGEIRRFDKPVYSGLAFTYECNIRYECKYVWEDDGELFDFNPAKVNGVILTV